MPFPRRLSLAAAFVALSGGLALGLMPEDAIVEQFDTLDREQWTVSDGWSNGSHQGCTWSKEMVEVEGGILRLKLGEMPATPTGIGCAEVQWRGKRQYGLYEVRMRTAAGKGLVSAFFTYTGPAFDGPHDEIDIEHLGKSPRKVQLNYYTDGEGGHEKMARLPRAGNEAFVTYGFLWEPEKITWFIEGEKVHEATGDDIPVAPGRIMLSLWNGTGQVDDWLGPFDAAGMPHVMEVDWMAYTPPGKTCLIEGSVSCKPDFSW